MDTVYMRKIYNITTSVVVTAYCNCINNTPLIKIPSIYAYVVLYIH